MLTNWWNDNQIPSVRAEAWTVVQGEKIAPVLGDKA